MKKIIGLLVVLFVLPFSFSDSAELTVTVGNSGPSVDNLIIDGQDSLASVQPNAGTTKTILLQAEISDINGGNDVNTVVCNITGSSIVDASPLSLNKGPIIDSDSIQFNNSFTMHFYDTPGAYQVSCSATDSSSLTSTRAENYTYESITALELDAGTIAFGSLTAGTTKNVTGDANMSSTTKPTIQNYGNIVIDAQIVGENLVAGNNTIAITNAQAQFGSLGFKTLNTTAITESALNLNFGAGAVQNIDFKLTVPIGTSSASYNGSITVAAVAG